MEATARIMPVHTKEAIVKSSIGPGSDLLVTLREYEYMGPYFNGEIIAPVISFEQLKPGGVRIELGFEDARTLNQILSSFLPQVPSGI